MGYKYLCSMHAFHSVQFKTLLSNHRFSPGRLRSLGSVHSSKHVFFKRYNFKTRSRVLRAGCGLPLRATSSVPHPCCIQHTFGVWERYSSSRDCTHDEASFTFGAMKNKILGRCPLTGATICFYTTLRRPRQVTGRRICVIYLIIE